jgi:hypothetical protein
MLAALPAEFWVMVGVCIAAMAVSAFLLGAPQWWQRGVARSGLIVAGGAVFAGVTAYVSVLAAAIVVVLPLVLVIAWFTDFFGGLFG